MNTIDQKQRYIQTVEMNYFYTLRETDNRIFVWINSLLNKTQDVQEIEEAAKRIFQDFPALRNLRRYQSCRTERGELLKLIFEESYRHNPDALIAAAQRVESKENFYPLWKEYCLIGIPKACGDIFGNEFIKIVLAFALTKNLVPYGNKAFFAIDQCVSKTTQIFIRHGPTQVAQLDTLISQAKQLIFASLPIVFDIFIGAALVKFVILKLPEIPYVTKIARKVNLLTAFFFVFGFAAVPTVLYYRAQYTVHYTSSYISFFLKSISRRAENEKLAICKERAFTILKNITECPV